MAVCRAQTAALDHKAQSGFILLILPSGRRNYPRPEVANFPAIHAVGM